MNPRNIALLLIVVALGAGLVYYQTNSATAPDRGSTGNAAPGSATGSEPRSPVSNAAAPAAQETSKPGGQPESVTEVAQDTWGRNPFAAVRTPAPAAATLPPPAEAPLIPAIETQAAIADSPSSEAEPLPAHVFSGVLISGGDSIVFLNGRLMRVGSKIGAETVREIRVDSVILESAGRTRELSRRTNPGAEKNGAKGI